MLIRLFIYAAVLLLHTSGSTCFGAAEKNGDAAGPAYESLEPGKAPLFSAAVHSDSELGLCWAGASGTQLIRLAAELSDTSRADGRGHFSWTARSRVGLGIAYYAPELVALEEAYAVTIPGGAMPSAVWELDLTRHLRSRVECMYYTSFAEFEVDQRVGPERVGVRLVPLMLGVEALIPVGVWGLSGRVGVGGGPFLAEVFHRYGGEEQRSLRVGMSGALSAGVGKALRGGYEAGFRAAYALGSFDSPLGGRGVREHLDGWRLGLDFVLPVGLIFGAE